MVRVYGDSVRDRARDRAEDAREQIEDTVDEAQDTVDETQEEVEDTVDEAQEDVEERAGEARDQVEDTVDSARRTFQEALDRVRGEGNGSDGGGSSGGGGGGRSNISASDLIDKPREEQVFEDLARAAPEDLETSARQERRAEAQQRLSDSVAGSLSPDLGISGLEDQVFELREIELQELSEVGLFGLIAEAVRTLTSIEFIRLENDISSLVILDEVASAVEPSRGITVTGTVTTTEQENPEVPEPVVPNTNDVSIPTKVLFVRADPANTENIYFGDDKLTPGDGFALRPGESQILNFDFGDGTVYMASESESQELHVMGML